MSQKLSWPLQSSVSKQRDGPFNPQDSEDPTKVWGMRSKESHLTQPGGSKEGLLGEATA